MKKIFYAIIIGIIFYVGFQIADTGANIIKAHQDRYEIAMNIK